MINFENIIETLYICRSDPTFSKSIENAISQLKKGDLILAGGNGGSATDAEHFVAELTGRYDGNTNVIPAMSMGSNFAEVTAFGNDYGYDNIYMPYCIGFKKASFLFITTSGRSKNILNALEYLTNNNQFMGGDTGIVVLTGSLENNHVYERYYGRKNIQIISVPSTNTQIIQEIHIMVLHYIAQEININGLF